MSSEYFRGAQRMQDFFGKKDYWTEPTEMFARAFESYIEDKLKSKDQKSQYLVHSTSNVLYKAMFTDPVTGEAPYPYPEGKERESINNSFDDFFKVFKEGKKFPEHKKSLAKSIKEIEQQKCLKAKRTRRKKRANKR